MPNSKREEEIEKNPELEDEEQDEDEEGISSMFGKILAKKLKGGSSKKRMAEVE